MSSASAVWNLYVYKAWAYPRFRTLENEQGAIRYFQGLLSVTSSLVQNQSCTSRWSYGYSSTLLHSCTISILRLNIQLPDDDVKNNSTIAFRAASTRSARHSITTAAAGECRIYPRDSKIDTKTVCPCQSLQHPCYARVAFLKHGCTPKGEMTGGQL
jgi:hypothetical protein